MFPNIFVVTFMKAMESHIKRAMVIHLEKLQNFDVEMDWWNIYHKYYPVFPLSASILFTYLMKIKCLLQIRQSGYIVKVLDSLAFMLKKCF